MGYFITEYNASCPEGSQRAALEDSIMHKGHPVTAGSEILWDYISPLDATVVTSLEAVGATIIGKTTMDEFGAAGLFEGSDGARLNQEPQSEAHDAGLSSGAIAAVRDGIASFALCNDYTGAVRRDAVGQGLCYIHPTYGTVSRYGLIPAVPSMDQIGIVCRTVRDGFRALDIISGYDPKDGAMRDGVGYAGGETNSKNGKPGRVRIGIPVNALSFPLDAAAVGVIGAGADDFDYVEFELKHFDVFTAVMQILCCAELSNNITRYDGVKFGYRARGFRDLHELYTMTRTQAFGSDAKLAAIIGAMVLSQENYTRFYDKAMRVRRLIKEAIDFSSYDLIALPIHVSYPNSAASNLALGALPQLCGLPAVSLPFCDGGVTLIADACREDLLLQVIGSNEA